MRVLPAEHSIFAHSRAGNQPTAKVRSCSPQHLIRLCNRQTRSTHRATQPLQKPSATTTGTKSHHHRRSQNHEPDEDAGQTYNHAADVVQAELVARVDAAVAASHLTHLGTPTTPRSQLHQRNLLTQTASLHLLTSPHTPASTHSCPSIAKSHSRWQPGRFSATTTGPASATTSTTNCTGLSNSSPCQQLLCEEAQHQHSPFAASTNACAKSTENSSQAKQTSPAPSPAPNRLHNPRLHLHPRNPSSNQRLHPAQHQPSQPRRTHLPSSQQRPTTSSNASNKPPHSCALAMSAVPSARCTASRR